MSMFFVSSGGRHMGFLRGWGLDLCFSFLVTFVWCVAGEMVGEWVGEVRLAVPFGRKNLLIKSFFFFFFFFPHVVSNGG